MDLAPVYAGALVLLMVVIFFFTYLQLRPNTVLILMGIAVVWMVGVPLLFWLFQN